MKHYTSRGEGWVVAQFALIALLLLAPRRGPVWPRRLAIISRLAGLPLLGGGGWLAARAFGNLGPNLTPLPRPKPGGHLVRDGVYGIVRHPIYSGLTLASLGLALLTASTSRLTVAAAIVAFFNAKADREERWLLDQYPGYAAYRDEVPKLWPSPW